MCYKWFATQRIWYFVYLWVKIRLLNQMLFKCWTKCGTFSCIALRWWFIMNWHQHLWDILESAMELMDANDHWDMQLQVLCFTFSLNSVSKKVKAWTLLLVLFITHYYSCILQKKSMLGVHYVYYVMCGTELSYLLLKSIYEEFRCKSL